MVRWRGAYNERGGLSIEEVQKTKEGRGGQAISKKYQKNHVRGAARKNIERVFSTIRILILDVNKNINIVYQKNCTRPKLKAGKNFMPQKIV